MDKIERNDIKHKSSNNNNKNKQSEENKNIIGADKADNEKSNIQNSSDNNINVDVTQDTIAVSVSDIKENYHSDDTDIIEDKPETDNTENAENTENTENAENEESANEKTENFYLNKPVRQKKKNRRRINFVGIIRIITFLIILSLIIYGLVLGIKKIAWNIANADIEIAPTREVSIPISGTLAYKEFQKGVIVANSGSVTYYDSDMNTIWEKTGFDGEPIIDVCKDYALVSYTGTPNALFIHNENSKPITGNGKIVTADINQDGYFALVMTEEGYKNQVVVFDNIGNVIYRWHSAENYVTSVSVSPDNSGMSTSTIGFSGNTFANSILMFDFSQDKPIMGQQQDNNLIMEVEYISKNKIAVIGDLKAEFYKKNGKLISTVDYENKKLLTFDICEDGTTVLCFSNDDSVMSNSRLVSFNTKGKQKGSFETDGKVLSISTADDKILAVRDREFDIFTEGMRKKSTMSVVMDIKNSVLLENGKSVFSISGNSGQLIDVR